MYMSENPNVIAFSYAKRALVKGSREYERMREYASVFTSHHVVVFTREGEGYPAMQTDGKLTLYATNAKTRIGMLFAAFRIGLSIVRKHPKTKFWVSGQDPFVASIVPWLLSFQKNVSLQVQIHGDIYNQYFFEGDVLGFAKKLFAKIVFSRAKKVRVVSKRIKESLVQRGVAAEKVVVLPIQPNLDSFFAMGENRTRLQKDTVDLLYIGRFAPEKDVELLLEAFALTVVEELPQYRLTLVGAGPLESAYKAQIKKLGLEKSISVLPWQDDIAELMRDKDLLCLSSKHEGYAMVLLEALAAGLPVVTTEVGCVGEVVTDGETGLVVRKHSAAAYAAALKSIASNPALYARMQENAVKVAKRHRLTKEAYLEAIKHSYLI
jgi:glycosyltransferase involved in cell wall biosynthesis